MSEPTQEPVAPQVTTNSPSSRVEPSPKMRHFSAEHPRVRKHPSSLLDEDRPVQTGQGSLGEIKLSRSVRTRRGDDFPNSKPCSILHAWKTENDAERTHLNCRLLENVEKERHTNPSKCNPQTDVCSETPASRKRVFNQESVSSVSCAKEEKIPSSDSL